MKKISEYGGYIEISGLIENGEYHSDYDFKLNSATNAIIHLLKAHKARSIYLPLYNCENVKNKIVKSGIEVKLYNIDNKFMPILDKNKIDPHSFFMYVNYYGICDDNLDQVIDYYNSLFKGIIVDNSQAFFSNPRKNVNSVYSPRKFLSVTDGSYLFCDKKLDLKASLEKSTISSNHLWVRRNSGSNAGYKDHKEVEKILYEEEISLMSESTQYLLKCFDYKAIKGSYKNNFDFFHENLKEFNELNISSNLDCHPICYPLLIKNGKEVRKQLVDKSVFIPSWWSWVLADKGGNDFESHLSNNLLPLPIDHRYNTQDLNKILTLLKLK